MSGKIHSRGFYLDADCLRTMSTEDIYAFAGLKNAVKVFDTIIEEWSFETEEGNACDACEIRPLPEVSRETVIQRSLVSMPRIKLLEPV